MCDTPFFGALCGHIRGLVPAPVSGTVFRFRCALASPLFWADLVLRGQSSEGIAYLSRRNARGTRFWRVWRVVWRMFGACKVGALICDDVALGR